MANEHDTWMGALGVGFARMNQMADETKAKLQSNLQAAQDAALAGVGASPETAAQIKAAEQAMADFEQGRDEGRSSGTIGLLRVLPPVQLVEAGVRIAKADDAGQEAENIAKEKANTVAGIAAVVGEAAADPRGPGAALGERFGERMGKDAVAAQKEGRLAKHLGNLVGHGEVIAATVAVTAGAGGAVAAGEVGIAGAGEVGIAGAGEVGIAGAGEVGVAGAGRWVSPVPERWASPVPERWASPVPAGRGGRRRCWRSGCRRWRSGCRRAE